MKVFDEPKDRKLPPQQPFDHAINLKQTFVPKVALHNLTKKGTPFTWKKVQDDAFIKLKETVLSAPVLQILDTSKQFFIMTNASLTASGGVLMQ